MIINNIDIAEKYGVKILEEKINPREITTFTDWLDNDMDPVTPKQSTFKKFDVYCDMIITAKSKEDAEILISNIVSDCQSGEIQLSNMKFTYSSELTDYVSTILSRWKYHLELTFSGYNKKGTEVKHEFKKSVTFDVSGNCDTPAIISITPVIDTGNLILKGFGDDITIDDILSSSPFIIDGEKCTVFQNGVNKFNSVDLWEFPVLSPGTHTVELSSTVSSAFVSYKPRYK